MTLCMPCNQAHTAEEMNVNFRMAKTQLDELKDALQFVSKTTQTCKSLASQLKSEHKQFLYDSDLYDSDSTIGKFYTKYLRPFNKLDARDHTKTYKHLNEISKLCRLGENELNKITKSFKRDYRNVATGETSRRNIEAEVRDWDQFRNKLVRDIRSKASQVETHFNRYAEILPQSAKPPLRLLRSVDQLSNLPLSIR